MTDTRRWGRWEWRRRQREWECLLRHAFVSKELTYTTIWRIYFLHSPSCVWHCTECWRLGKRSASSSSAWWSLVDCWMWYDWFASYGHAMSTAFTHCIQLFIHGHINTDPMFTVALSRISFNAGPFGITVSSWEGQGKIELTEVRDVPDDATVASFGAPFFKQETDIGANAKWESLLKLNYTLGGSIRVKTVKMFF